MLDERAFRDGMAALVKTFGGTVDRARAELYFAALEDLDTEAWVRATERAMLELKFFPRPAELRKLAGEHSVESRAAIAWREARNASSSSAGSYESVDFEDKAINATIRAVFGTWRAFGHCPEGELEDFKRREFLALYPTFARAVTPEQARHLVGLAEHQGHGRPPKRIPATTALVGGGPRMLGPGSGASGPALIGGGR